MLETRRQDQTEELAEIFPGLKFKAMEEVYPEVQLNTQLERDMGGLTQDAHKSAKVRSS